MAIGAIIFDEENRAYKLLSLLGAGAIGGVFLGQNEAEPTDQIAVKVPHARLSTELQARFWQELAVLTKLRAQDPRFFPAAWRGRNRADGREVLCMALARGERLVTLAARADHHLEEKLALTAGEQYAAMLMAMERAGISCPDRKPNDLYWETTAQRLTVLDWNVVEQEKDKVDPASDIYIFGRLWYELLTGALPSPLQERQARPLQANPHWLQLSVGLQQILRKALAPVTAGRYTSATALYKDLQRHYAAFNLPAATLVAEAQKALETAQNEYKRVIPDLTRQRQQNQSTVNDLSATAAQPYNQALAEALRLADLAQRFAPLEGAECWQAAQAFEAQSKQPINQVTEYIQRVKYDEALALLAVAEMVAADDPPTVLNLQRWRIVAEAGRDGATYSLFLSNHLAELRKVIEALAAKRTDAAEVWERVEAELDKKGWRAQVAIWRQLAYLGHEAHFYKARATAGQAEQDGNGETALQALTTTIEHLHNLNGCPRYLQLITAVHGESEVDLQARLKELRARMAADLDLLPMLARIKSCLQAGDIAAAANLLRDHSPDARVQRAGWRVSQPEPRLKQIQELIEIGEKLQSALTAKAWDTIFAQEAGLVAQLWELDNKRTLPGIAECAGILARAAFEKAIDELSAYYDNSVSASDRKWRKAKQLRTIASLLCLADHLRTWQSGQYQAWFGATLGWRA